MTPEQLRSPAERRGEVGRAHRIKPNGVARENWSLATPLSQFVVFNGDPRVAVCAAGPVDGGGAR